MQRRSGIDGCPNPFVRHPSWKIQKTNIISFYDSVFCRMVRRQNKRILRRQGGTTLIEAMIAMSVFLIIMLGGIQYFFLPQSTMAQQKFKRLAISVAKNRMESIRAMKYSQITTALNETNTPVSLGGISGERSTTINLVDDAADGLAANDKDGNLVDYKTVDVTVSWKIHKIRAVFLATIISDFKD